MLYVTQPAQDVVEAQPDRLSNGSRTLSPRELEAFGRAMDRIRDEILEDLGPDDVAHIKRVIRASHYSAVVGRALLHFGFDPLSFALGTAALSLAKILENMEIGHNVMHGQYDWTGDPELDGQSYEWDHLCDSGHWRNYHNYEHHTFTNVLGKDRDIGYTSVRVTEQQPWHPRYLLQPLVALTLATQFQWGVAGHDLRIDETLEGKQSLREQVERAKPLVRKAIRQLGKDYVVFPALAGLNAPRVLVGNALANLGRNLWTFAVIFCGHFPDGAVFYPEEALEDESRGGWYVRQLNGSVNIEGSHLFHVLTGHLSHQIEHHLFPDLPASRYPQAAEEVQELCAMYGQTYNTGRFGTQLKSVVKNLLRFSLPSRAAQPS